MTDQHTPITIQTYADLLEHGLTLAYHCQPCQRWVDVDLASLVAAGRGDDIYIGQKVRCTVCGQLGSGQISPSNTAGRA
jgi:hypothetical protein